MADSVIELSSFFKCIEILAISTKGIEPLLETNKLACEVCANKFSTCSFFEDGVKQVANFLPK